MSYVSQANRVNPTSLTAAVIWTGGIITALMFMSMSAGVRENRPDLKTFEVKDRVPPPEPKIEPKQVEDQLPTTPPVFVPDPIGPVIQQPIEQLTTTNNPPVTPPLPTGGTLGEGTQIASLDVKKLIPPITPPAPIFKSASRDPRFAGKFQPTYPVGMLQREIEGTVTIKVLIGTDGRVRQTNVIKAATPEFAAATEKQALSQWRFKPATRDGQPVEDWQTLTVRFDIN
jgi:periplasmic protein TonB